MLHIGFLNDSERDYYVQRVNKTPLIIPPPLIVALFFLAGYTLHTLHPLPLLSGDLNLIPALWLSLGGLILFLAAVRALRKAGTSPSPYKDTTALVTTGPYLRSRNPIYLAFMCLYLGLAFWINTLWPVALFPGLIVAMKRLVILREESRLEARFGAEYRAYKSRVRRWA
jgi:protein-S-isoprenylcysteine O-methyltransferase Ste14